MTEYLLKITSTTKFQIAGKAQRRLIPAQSYLARVQETTSKAKRDKKTVIDLRNKGRTPISSSAKEKRKASDVEDDSDDSDATAVDGPFTPTTLARAWTLETTWTPSSRCPNPLLQARVQYRGWDKDEQRKHKRAVMREQRRNETKEKIRKKREKAEKSLGRTKRRNQSKATLQSIKVVSDDSTNTMYWIVVNESSRSQILRKPGTARCTRRDAGSDARRQAKSRRGARQRGKSRSSSVGCHSARRRGQAEESGQAEEESKNTWCIEFLSIFCTLLTYFIFQGGKAHSDRSVDGFKAEEAHGQCREEKVERGKVIKSAANPSRRSQLGQKMRRLRSRPKARLTSDDDNLQSIVTRAKNPFAFIDNWALRNPKEWNRSEKRLKTIVDMAGHLELMEHEAKSPLALPITIQDEFGDIKKVVKNDDPFFLE
ncbi:hypothetical protein C8J56DRAFT_904225 [Mycena floridula]|nr:hypothetical protein C8J56DRAFT_904225 [Mycena floridula]